MNDLFNVMIKPYKFPKNRPIKLFEAFAGVLDGSLGEGGDVGQVFTIITNGIFGGISTALGVELFMGLTIGAIVLIPLIFGLISFIVGGKKK